MNDTKYSDKELLDYLQKCLNKRSYTGHAIMRWSNNGRGIRLHETSMKGAKPSIRQAIADHIDYHGK